MKKHILSSLNLYGVISLNDLLKVLNHYLNYITKDELIKELNTLTKDINFDISFIDNIIYSSDFDPLDDDDLIEANYLLLESNNLPFYLPSEEIFLLHSDEFYIENNNSLNNLISFINENNLYKENYDGELKRILTNYFTKRGEAYLHDAYIKHLKQIGFKFNNNENEFKNLLELLKYDLRLYSNKANTINELIELNLANDLVDPDLFELLINLLKTKDSVSTNELINYSNDDLITNTDIKLLISFIKNNKDLNVIYENELFSKK